MAFFVHWKFLSRTFRCASFSLIKYPIVVVIRKVNTCLYWMMKWYSVLIGQKQHAGRWKYRGFEKLLITKFLVDILFYIVDFNYCEALWFEDLQDYYYVFFLLNNHILLLVLIIFSPFQPVGTWFSSRLQRIRMSEAEFPKCSSDGTDCHGNWFSS